ncbi:MAG: LptF/LptG family permease [Flavobacteriales bacterium]|nr:LptF/LptG family permease [Flavobacteriales bacterium]
MIKKIDWYIIKKFLGSFALTLGLFTVIIIVFDVAEKVDDFVQKQVPFKEIINDYYLNFVPFLLNLFSPIFVFITVIFFTSKLASKSEIIAILSSGASYFRLLRPYMITAIIIALFSFVLNAWIIPRADKVRVRFENKWIRELQHESKRDIVQQLVPGVFMSLQSFNYIDSLGYNIQLDKIENGSVKSRLFGNRVRWNPEVNKWRIYDYRIREFDKTGNITSIKSGNSLDTVIPFNPDDFFRRQDDVQSFNLNELNKYIELEKFRGTGQSFFYETEKQKRFVGPFSMLILTFIGVCVSSIKSRRGVGWNLAKGILLSFTYLFIIQFFTSMGSSGTMLPALAVWIPNVIFIFVGIWLYANTQK